MPGGVIQLISTGNHDVYLTGCPQITYFKKVYKKYTHFAMEAIEQEFNTGANFNSYISATLCRDADLLSKLILEMKFSVEPVIPLSSMTTVNGYITLAGDLPIYPSGTYYGSFYIDNFGGSDFIFFDNSTIGVRIILLPLVSPK